MTLRLAALALAAPLTLSPACELDDGDPCGDAKQHLCSKIEDQVCNTSTMDKAVSRIREDCGSPVAVSFTAAAEAYCRSAGTDLSVSACTKL